MILTGVSAFVLPKNQPQDNNGHLESFRVKRGAGALASTGRVLGIQSAKDVVQAVGFETTDRNGWNDLSNNGNNEYHLALGPGAAAGAVIGGPVNSMVGAAIGVIGGSGILYGLGF